jgi:carboxyl-terminal processing protease
LVQEEFSIDDLGALRLTVARFYTPTGRAIQRPYGEGIDYSGDYFDRYESGELFHQDSIALADSLLYQTPKGKWVHGGGGITPDVFLPLDTARLSGYLSELSWSGVLRDAAFSFVDENRDKVLSQDQLKSKAEPWKKESLEFLLQYAEQAGLPQEAEMTDLEEDELANRMLAQIIRNIDGESSYYEYLATEDPAVQEAQRWLKNKRNIGVVNGRLTLSPSE